MNRQNFYPKLWVLAVLMGTAMTLISCSDDDKNETTQQPAPADSTSTIVSTYDPDEVYAGGRLGTAFITSKSAFEQPMA